MPTGYTERIKDGMDFRGYALRCARQFGSLIRFREESLDMVLPDKIEPHDYHQKKLEEVEAEINNLYHMFLYDCDIAAMTEYTSSVQRYEEQITEHEELEQKYRAMEEKVRQWNPPTKDHEGLKTFMLEQLANSIDFDCEVRYYKQSLSKLAPKTGKQWKAEEMKRLVDSQVYHIENWHKELNTVKKLNTWLTALRNSL